MALHVHDMHSYYISIYSLYGDNKVNPAGKVGNYTSGTLTRFKLLFPTSRVDDVFIFGTQFLNEAV